jgi:F0F1-type ATP synthase epsilon subunit
MADDLRLLIRTPHATVFDAPVSGARVPTETGQVGIRPRQEALVLVVEPGLVLLHSGNARRFAATAGGLFEGDGEHGVLYTPFAAVGDDETEVLTALDRAFASPDSEIAARKRLGELQQRIVLQLQRRPQDARPRPP